jgi:hypothetical protein
VYMSVRRWNALHLAFPLRCKCGLHARQVTLQGIDAREGYPTSSLGLPMCNEPMKTGSCTGSLYALNAAAKLMLQAVSQHMNSITTQHQTSSLQRSRYAHIRAATGHASPQMRVMSLLSLQSDHSPGLASPTLPRPNSKGKLALLLPVKQGPRSGPLYCCTRFNCSCACRSCGVVLRTTPQHDVAKGVSQHLNRLDATCMWAQPQLAALPACTPKQPLQSQCWSDSSKHLRRAACLARDQKSTPFPPTTSHRQCLGPQWVLLQTGRLQHHLRVPCKTGFRQPVSSMHMQTAALAACMPTMLLPS